VNWYKLAQLNIDLPEVNTSIFTERYFNSLPIILNDNELKTLYSTNMLGPFNFNVIFSPNIYPQLLEATQMFVEDNLENAFEELLTKSKIQLFLSKDGTDAPYYDWITKKIYIPILSISKNFVQQENHLAILPSPFHIFHEIGHMVDHLLRKKIALPQMALSVVWDILTHSILAPWAENWPYNYSDTEKDADSQAILVYLNQIKNMGKILSPQELEEFLNNYGLTPKAVSRIISIYAKELEKLNLEVNDELV